MNGPPRPIATPCVKVCMVDGRHGHCVGCLRTLPEIARWGAMTDQERAAVMADLPRRGERVDSATHGRV